MNDVTEKRANKSSPKSIPFVLEKEERNPRATRPAFEIDAGKTASTIEDVARYLRYCAYRHNQGFYHYTSFGNLNRLLTKVKIGECERYLFKLSSPDALNDAMEVESLRGSRVLSMSYGAEENVAMWTNYGLPRKDAVRLRFSKKAVMDWLEKCGKSLANLCFVKEGNAGEKYKELVPAEIRIGDVLYVAHHGNGRVAEQKMTIYDAPNGQTWEDFLNDDKNAHIAPLVKSRGWAYERETRLVVKFSDSNMITQKDVYLDFTSVIDDMLNRTCNAGNILYGPWFNERRFLAKLKTDWPNLDKSPAKAQRRLSVYNQELKMSRRLDCFRSKCPKHRKCPESCECPYKED